MRPKKYKKRKKGISKGMQSVRVDSRTVIQVSIDKDPKQAVEEYLEKLKSSTPTYRRMNT